MTSIVPIHEINFIAKTFFAWRCFMQNKHAVVCMLQKTLALTCMQYLCFRSHLLQAKIFAVVCVQQTFFALICTKQNFVAVCKLQQKISHQRCIQRENSRWLQPVAAQPAASSQIFSLDATLMQNFLLVIAHGNKILLCANQRKKVCCTQTTAKIFACSKWLRAQSKKKMLYAC